MQIQFKCIDCGATFPLDEVRYTCDCGGLLDVARDLEELRELVSREAFDARIGGRKLADASGVWRFRELILPVPEDQIVSRPKATRRSIAAQGFPSGWGWTIWRSSTKAKIPPARSRIAG